MIGRVIAAARWLVRTEIGIWRSLFLLVARRKSGQRLGVQTVSYAKEITPLIAAFVFVSAIELPVVHLLIPWNGVRLAVLVLSVWGLLWMIGMLASMRVFPHLIGAEEIRVRYGAHVDVRVPWSAIESVKLRRGSVPSSRNLHVEDGIASVPVLKRTNVELALREPTRLPGADAAAVSAVRLYVDRPREFVEAVRGHAGYSPPLKPEPAAADAAL